MFVSRLSWDGKSLDASTFLGGGYTEREPRMALDGFGNIWLSGSTTSLDFPTSAGAYQDTAKIGLDVFVTAMAPDLSGIGVSTLVGEDGNDVPRSIDIGPSGELLVAGFTTSLTFPDPPDPPVLVNSGETDGFMLILEKDLVEHPLDRAEFERWRARMRRDFGVRVFDPQGRQVAIPGGR